MKAAVNTPSKELKSLFRELVENTTNDCKRRDWAIIRWKNLAPFNQFSIKSLMIG